MILEVGDQEILDDVTWSVLVKLRAGYACEECGIRGTREGSTAVHPRRGKLVAHHIAGDRHLGNHTLENGRALCHSCHKRAHIQMNKEAA